MNSLAQKRHRPVWFLLALLLAPLADEVLGAPVNPPDRRAFSRWLTDFSPSNGHCAANQRNDFGRALTNSGRGGQTWSADEAVQFILSLVPPSEFSYQGIKSDLTAAPWGYLHFATSGSSGRMGVEFYDFPADALTAAAGFDGNGTTYNETSLPGGAWVAALTTTGIGTLPRGEKSAFFANFKDSWESRSAYWQDGAHAAVSYRNPFDWLSQGCPNYDAFMRTMACDFWISQGRDNTFTDAAQGRSGMIALAPTDGPWRFSAINCFNIAARFDRVGAFGDKVWASVNQYNSASFEIVGFPTTGSWPKNGVGRAPQKLDSFDPQLL